MLQENLYSTAQRGNLGARFIIVALLAGALLFSSSLRAQPTSFTLTGASEQLERNLRAHIAIPNISCDASQARLRRFVPRIKQDIDRAGRALGYYLLVDGRERYPRCAGDDVQYRGKHSQRCPTILERA